MDISGVPLTVLEAIKPFIQAFPKKVTATTNGKFYIRLNDINPSSPFYFEVYKSHKDNDMHNVDITHRPVHDELPINTGTSLVSVSQLSERIKTWLYYVDQYKSFEPIYTLDAFTQQTQEAFYSQFEFIDDEQKKKPLNLDQLLALDEHLTFLSNKVIELSNDNNSEYLSEISRDIEIARTALTQETKQSIIQRVTTIWAKITKTAGAKFIIELAKDFIKDKLKAAIDVAIQNPEKVHELIEKAKHFGA